MFTKTYYNANQSVTSDKEETHALTRSVVLQMMARFRNFYNVKKVKTQFKKAQCVSNRCKDLFKQKKYILRLWALLIQLG